MKKVRLKPFSPTLVLFDSQEQMTRFAHRFDKEWGAPENNDVMGRSGEVYDKETHTNYYLVWVNLKDPRHKDRLEIIDTSVHEGIHVYQALMNNVGESRPAIEFEAYFLAWLTRQIYEYYLEKK